MCIRSSGISRPLPSAFQKCREGLKRLSPTLPLSHSLTLSLSHTLTLSHSRTLSLSLALSLSHSLTLARLFPYVYEFLYTYGRIPRIPTCTRQDSTDYHVYKAGFHRFLYIYDMIPLTPRTQRSNQGGQRVALGVWGPELRVEG